MNNREFDLAIRRRIEKEAFQVNPKIEDTLQRTLKNPQAYKKVAKVTRRGLALAIAVAVLLCGAAFALSNFSPKPDKTTMPLAQETESIVPAVTDTGAHTNEAASLPLPTILPDDISIAYAVSYSRWKWDYQITFTNPTSQTFFVDWKPLPDAMLTESMTVVPPKQGLCLYPGATMTDSATGYTFGSTSEDIAKMGLITDCYTAATALFEQQSTLPDETDISKEQMANEAAAKQAEREDAFAAGKILVVDGQLALPESYLQENPNTSPIEYYYINQMLTQQSRTAESIECSQQTLADVVGDDPPLAQMEYDGFTARLMKVENLYSSPYVVVDLLFKDETTREQFTQEYPKLAWVIASQGRMQAVYRGIENLKMFSTGGRAWSNPDLTEHHLTYTLIMDQTSATEEMPLTMIANVIGERVLEEVSLPLNDAAKQQESSK